MSEPEEPSDEELARRAASGDLAAFTQLCDRHQGRVFARLTKMIGPVPEREDVLIDILYKLHTSLPSFRGESSFTTYLYGITWNVACDHLRKRSRRLPMALEDQALEELADTVEDPTARSYARYRLELLFALLDQLKANLRVAFVLVAIDGLTHEEAAAQLCVSPQAVKRRVLRARKKLLALVERQERRGAVMAWRSA